MGQLIEWSDTLNLGIEEIDCQHRDLVALVNEMHRALHDGHGVDAVSPVLGSLADSARIHFAVEESLMRLLGYPDYESHRCEHREQIRTLSDLRCRVDSGETVVDCELMRYLKSWLIRHIAEGDRPYGRFFSDVALKLRNCTKSWATRPWDPLRD